MTALKPAFHEVVLPARLAFGSIAATHRKTEVIETASGFEQRNTPWSQSRRKYRLTTEPRPLVELYALLAFFEARQGRLIGFRWHDWLDFKSCAPDKTAKPTDQICRALDDAGRFFGLQKQYGSGADKVFRRILKPCAGSVVVAIDGVVLDKTDYQVNTKNGTVTLLTPVSHLQKVTAGFDFDVPVRFDTDQLDIALIAPEAGRLQPTELVELHLDETRGAV